MPGCLVAAMDVPAEKKGQIYLPDQVRNTHFADSGVVLASGHPDYAVGDRILAIISAGIKFEAYSTHVGDLGHVRFYGLVTESKHGTIKEDLNLVIPAVIDGENITPKGKWCVLKADPIVSSEGGILLSEKSQHGTLKGTCISASMEATLNGVEPGSRWQFHPKGMDYEILNYRENRHFFIKWTDLYVKIQ